MTQISVIKYLFIPNIGVLLLSEAIKKQNVIQPPKAINAIPTIPKNHSIINIFKMILVYMFAIPILHVHK